MRLSYHRCDDCSSLSTCCKKYKHGSENCLCKNRGFDMSAAEQAKIDAVYERELRLARAEYDEYDRYYEFVVAIED